MAKKYLGLDIGPQHAYLVILDIDRNEVKNVQLLESHKQGLTDQLAELSGQISGDFKIVDRLAAALPAKSAFIRNLQFPFSESKKIMAALPYAMSSEIPAAIDDCFTAALPLKKDSKSPAQVTAAAVPTVQIEDLLEQTEQCGLPIHILDLSPFVLLSGLGKQMTQGILLAANSAETTLSIIEDGRIVDYRLLAQPLTTKNMRWLNRELSQFTARTDSQNLTVYCVGDGITTELTAALLEQGFQVKELTMSIAGQQIPMPFMQAAALAFRAGMAKEVKSFNLRQGSFALKGEWQKLKKSLWCTGILVGLTIIILATAAGLKYNNKIKQANKIQQEITQIYRNTFPDATTIVDVPLQMQAAINELREKNTMVGSMGPDALTVLKKISEQVENIAIEVDEFNYNSSEVRVTGKTSSFETVNKLSEQLATSPLFSNVQVADAQMALRGSQINFRLILTLAQGGISQ